MRGRIRNRSGPDGVFDEQKEGKGRGKMKKKSSSMIEEEGRKGTLTGSDQETEVIARRTSLFGTKE